MRSILNIAIDYGITQYLIRQDKINQNHAHIAGNGFDNIQRHTPNRTENFRDINFIR